MFSSAQPVIPWTAALVRRAGVQLFLTSFLALYAELLFIRWIPAHVRFLTYFTNFILLASFLGLGVGILSARRRAPLGPFTLSWLVLALSALVLAGNYSFNLTSPGLLYYGASDGGPIGPSENPLVLPATFLLVTFLFVCIGRPLGLLLREVTPPLRAYALDIGGSLAGIAAFFVLSLTEQPPVVWFAGLLVLILVLAGSRWRDRLITLAPLALATGIAAFIGSSYWWSPYYKIGLTPVADGQGWALNVNEIAHQTMLPSDQKEPFYRVPYDLFGQGTFQHALIIGAGSGSDTAIALRNGVGSIDAVEIDPVIAQLGRLYHPDQPFSDPRVSVHIDDGRAFLRNSSDRYDLIVFALPDSAALTSPFASIRLESFLFTEQAFQAARDHLTSDGVLVLYNYYHETWLLRKLAGMVETSFGQPPYAMSYGGWGRAGVIVDGPRLSDLLATRPDLAQPFAEIQAPAQGLEEDPNAILLPVVGSGILASTNPAGDSDASEPPPATDDWPLLYLREPGIPSVYLIALAMAALVALGLVLGAAPRRALNARGFNAHMFFLGVGFLLLETRSLVTFSLLFGSTWLVNSLVFFAILSSVLLAILLSARFSLGPSIGLYALLVAALLMAFVIPSDTLLAVNPAAVRYALASVIAFLPVFLGNVLFASSFKLSGQDADVAFASNLLGAMVGGMLEYTSLLLGYRNLLLIVLACYALSGLLLHLRSASRLAAPGSPGAEPLFQSGEGGLR